MSGQLLNRDHVLKLIETKKINITNFHEERLQEVWYELHPNKIWRDTETKLVVPNYEPIIDIRKDRTYDIRPSDYIEVEVEERIILEKGFVGIFVPASRAIEDGLIITTGKLDSGYELRIMFGVYNAKSRPSVLYFDFPVAYVAFFDVGVSTNNSFDSTNYQKIWWPVREKDFMEVKDMLKKIIDLLRKK